ncbi:hypothetical protein LXM94_13380 [Rhizobium sp. TRM95111]|uniref:hypothetical protein n=1 Tax=Rhizobium alarense TaxID=2846851 RepID=UPI001F2F953C|nr:hypothetical protein [Rhizobium alarense]MCF3640964.1 hypothetical protein [Rhizobium alarense]
MIYVGPEDPKGLESNLIPNTAKRPLPAMRFDGPTEELNGKIARIPDFDLVQ